MAFVFNQYITIDPSGNVLLTTTPTAGDNTTKIATTAFVATASTGVNFDPTAIVITGGSINNTSIGGSTASTARFTTGTITTLNTANVTLSGTLTHTGGLIKHVRVISAAGTITVGATDQVIVVNKTIGAATAITLPSSPATGRRITIKDGRGDAATNNLTISPAAGNIDADTTLVIDTNYDVAELVYNGSAWSVLMTKAAVLGLTESPDGFTVTIAGQTMYASQTMHVASSGPYNLWQLTANPGQIILNGTVQSTSGNVIALVYHNHTMFQHATDNSTFDDWWYWNTTTVSYTEFSIASFTLSNQAIAASSPINTVVGTLATTMSDGSTFAGTYTVNDTTDFKIVGSSLETAVANLASGTYTITLTATPAVVGNAATLSTSITVGTTLFTYATGAPASIPNTSGATSPLSGWTVDFFDDFTGTFTTTGTAPDGWHQGFSTGALYQGAPAPYVYTTEGWGGGSWVSVNDNSLLTMSGSRLNFQCVDRSGTSHGCGLQVLFLDTVWGYWEANLKVPIGANGLSNGFWVGWWLSGYNWPEMGEIDILESTNTGIASSVHLGTAPNTDNLQFGLYNNSTLPGGHTSQDGFHTYGVLVTPSYLALYVDGVRLTTTTQGLAGGSLNTNAPQPSAPSPGTIGYLNNSITTWGTITYSALLGFFLGQWGFGSGGSGATYSAATLPATMQCDWIRHSVLNPLTGGPHA